MRGSNRRLASENAALQRLHEVSVRLISEDALPTLLQAVVEAAITVTDAAMGTLQLSEPDSDKLSIVAHCGFPPALLEKFQLVRADGLAICGEALRLGERVLVEDLGQSPSWLNVDSLEILREAGIGSVQSTPMRARDGRLIGMISTHWREPSHPDDATLRIMDLLARQAADLIEHRQRESALRESEARLTAETAALARLNDASSRLWRLQSLEQGLNEMLEATIELLGADKGNVQILDLERGVLSIVAQRGFGPDFLRFFREVSIDDDSACGRALRTRERVVVEDVDVDPGFAPYRPIAHAAGFRAVLSIPLISPSGRVLGMLSTHFCAPHRPGETELRCLDLYARQAADLIDRKRAEDALRAADRRKDEFLATLAHELRNPLAPISNALHILRESEGTDAGTRTRLLGMMERQTKHLVRLVDDLLEISRITCGKIELKKARVNLADVLNDAVESTAQAVQNARHQLSVALPAERLLLDADPVRLTQIFANLLNNAAKYTEAGGQIALRAERQQDHAVISVSDTGVGISAAMLPRVFDLFAQVDRKPDRNSDGLGIGLALVRSLVNLHGGRVEAHSRGLGRGSEFVVRLPLAEAGPVYRAVGQDSLPLAPLRILITDDHADAADSLAIMLGSWGNDVRVAYSGQAALELISSFAPSVVLLDLGMPGMSGFEVARCVRQNPNLRDVLLIALTGWGQEDDRRHTRDAGFDHHLTKPLSIEALRKLMAPLVSARARTG